jgi:hypothetical protein
VELATDEVNPQLEVIQHVWRYWAMWSYSASSLFQWPPKCTVRVTVCCTHEDPKAMVNVGFFAEHPERPPNVTFLPLWMPRTKLLRRAIGRNVACQQTRATVAVWMTDADYLFGEGALDAACERFPDNDILAYPRRLHRCTVERGEALIRDARDQGVRQINTNDFTGRQRLGRAIGGAQIYRADAARKFGYLPDHRKFQSPTGRWQRTHCDKAFRWLIETHGTGIDIPNVFRMAHQERGRDRVGVEN